MESNENISLTPRQMQVIPYILSSCSIEEAARRAEISPKQIYEWLKINDFKQELNNRRDEIFCEGLSFLKSSVSRASQTLVSLLDASDERLKMQVADKIINNACKAAELLDFEQRIAILEQKVKDEKLGL